MKTRSSRTRRVVSPRGRSRVVGGVAAVAVTAAVLTGCQSPDEGRTTGGMSVDASPPASTSTASTGAEAAGAPVTQVGDGSGLAETDYVPVDRGVFPQVDDSDPQQVLTRGLEVSFGWDPARDATQFEGFRRAKSLWNNQYLRSRELGLSTLVPMSSRAWQSWGDKGTRIVPRVDVLSDQHPPDTATDFHRVVAIDQTELTAGGASDGEVVTTLVATVRVHKTPLAWRLETINVIDNIVGGSHARQQQ